MTADTLARDPELGSYPILCDLCGRSLECSPADIRVFMAIGPPLCCGRPMQSPDVPLAPVPPPRPGRRRPARPGAGVGVRRRGPGPALELAEGLVDVSSDGVGVRLDVSMIPGEAVEITLQRPGATRPLVLPGEVRWCRPAAGGRYLAGLRLSRPLTPSELDGLAR
jgi:hypothetical protein